MIFNARSETVLEKRNFQRGICHHRAVIPARHFYEWNRSKEKFTFWRNDSPLLFLAGFYDFFEGEERLAILTTGANASMRKVHERMPLILEPEQVEGWICSDQLTGTLLRQIPPPLEWSVECEQQTLF